MRTKLRHWTILTLLALSLLLVNFMQMFTLVLRPFTVRGFRIANRTLADLWWGLLVDIGLRHGEIEVQIIGEPLPPGEDAIVIANHQCMADIFVILTLARTKGRLGDLKFFAKKAIQWVPGIGWGLWFLDCIFLDREWSRDAGKIRKAFEKFNAPPGEAPRFWIVSFPEGTRLTPNKLTSSLQHQIKNGRTATRHVLAPRTKGFVATIQGLRNRPSGPPPIYDLTLHYPNGVPSLDELLRLEGMSATVHCRRIEMKDLPESEAHLGQWLTNQFVIKDQLLESM